MHYHLFALALFAHVVQVMSSLSTTSLQLGLNVNKFPKAIHHYKISHFHLAVICVKARYSYNGSNVNIHIRMILIDILQAALIERVS